MPAGPNDIARITVPSQQLVQYVITKVDEALKDPRYVAHERMAHPDHNLEWWNVYGEHELTLTEQCLVVAAYVRAGWPHVGCINSSDIGDRPGRWKVRLAKRIDEGRPFTDYGVYFQGKDRL